MNAEHTEGHFEWIDNWPMVGTEMVLYYTTADDGLHGKDADKKRLADCWNACAGIPDPAQLRADRDALLEACKLWLVYDEGEQRDGVELMLDYADALAATRAAVARIRGEG